jgi:hypothetical protein
MNEHERLKLLGEASEESVRDLEQKRAAGTFAAIFTLPYSQAVEQYEALAQRILEHKSTDAEALAALEHAEQLRQRIDQDNEG